jgi:hypothetical protein
MSIVSYAAGAGADAGAAPTGFAAGGSAFNERSPRQTQTFTPILPYTVFASANP